MKRIEFYKLQAAGNDFILLDARKQRLLPRQSYKNFAQRWCERKLGVGADGLLVIESSKKAEFKMRIFNPDGSEAEMCGNGARCVALWARWRKKTAGDKPKDIKFGTKAGIIETQVVAQKLWKEREGIVKVKMVQPRDLKLGLPITIFARRIKTNYINVGVPHTIIFVEGLDKLDVEKIGRAIRYHRMFKPQGTNVDFVEIVNNDYIKIRTYERGVEAETLACGTGVVASAILTSYHLKNVARKIKIRVATKSKEELKVYFQQESDKIDEVWLEGKAYFVYKGYIVSFGE